MPTKKSTAKTVSLSDLAKSIDKAVEIASANHQVKLEPSTLLNKWEIVGRVVQGGDLNAASKFAQEITSRVSVAGLKPQPVTLKIGKQILVGFVDRSQLPRQLSR